jgi:hypothetical protein
MSLFGELSFLATEPKIERSLYLLKRESLLMVFKHDQWTLLLRNDT